MHYAIVGKGLAKKNVIEDALADLNNEDVLFHIHGYRGASESEKRVYTWLIDNEARFLVYGTSINSLLKEHAEDVQETENPESDMLYYVGQAGGEMLLLWDEADEEASELYVLRAYEHNIPVKDLTMGLTPAGLTPITVETEIPTEPRELTYADTETVELEVPEEPKNITTSIPNAAVKYETVSARDRIETTDDKPCMATIVLPNGTVASLPISMEEAKMILGLG